MPQVTLKIHADSAAFEEIQIHAAEGECVEDLLSSYAGANEVFRKVVFDEKSRRIQMTAVVFINGRVVNPYDRSKTTLMEGDEVTVLSMTDGG
jgi:molybdopterin converting factor small subunit